MFNNKFTILLCVLVAVTMAFACGESGDHRDVQRALSTSGENASKALVDGMVMLESSAMVNEYAFGAECAGGTCGDMAPDSASVEGEYEELHDLLSEYVFTSDNIEESGSGDVTYLLRGEVLCADLQEYPEDYDYCVSEVNSAEVRLVANFVGDETVAIDILLGPDEIYALTFTFGPEQLSVSTVLDNWEDVVDYLTDLAGEEMVPFPDRLEGEVEFGYYASGDDHRVALSIHDDVGVEVAGDFSLDIGAAGEVLAFGMNPAEETLSGSLGLDSFALSFVESSYGARGDYDYPEESEFTDEWGLTANDDPAEIGIQFDGMTGTVVFDPNAEQLTWSDVGLGGSPFVMTVNGEEVLNIALNSNMGGMLDGIMELEGDDLKISVTPGFELEFGTFFHRVAGDYDDFEEWMLDEVLSIVLHGDDSPAVLVTWDDFQVLRGQLDFTSEATDHGFSVEAGMCIDEVATSGTDYHPFADLEEAQCRN